MNLNPLFQCFGNLFFGSRHFVPILKAHEVNFLCSEPHGGPGNIQCLSDFCDMSDFHSFLACSSPCNINGYIAAADDDNLVSELDSVAEIDVEEEIYGTENAVEFQPFDLEVATLVCTNRDEKGLKSLLSKICEGKITTNGGVKSEFNTETEDGVDLKAY